MSFMDAQVGRILDALEASGRADDTVVVLWGDHGYHLGEKAISGKNTLWERSTRVPLVFAGPGVPAGVRDRQPAELLDVYPTLLDLCGLAPRPDLEGLSLMPQVRVPTRPRLAPAITTHNQGNHAVRSERWRYIRYADGSEELYDVESDPREWTNLAGRPGLERMLAEHRAWLPRVDRPMAPGSQHRVLSYDSARDEATWEGALIRRADPVPE
jgi:arylsulfatase A-like enzyme